VTTATTSDDMEQETLFTAVKWEILQALATGRKSPLELSEINKTSISNISQSLRFLELGGLVKSDRISNRDKGLPRVIYGLNGDKAYLIVASEGFATKGFVDLDAYRKARLRIWLFENRALQQILEQALEQLKDSLEKITYLALDKTALPEIKLLFSGDIKTDISITISGSDRKLKMTKISGQDLKKMNAYVIHETKILEEK
jgi:predicted transcriptional regulator